MEGVVEEIGFFYHKAHKDHKEEKIHICFIREYFIVVFLCSLCDLCGKKWAQ